MRLESYAPRRGQLLNTVTKQNMLGKDNIQAQLSAGVGWLRDKLQSPDGDHHLERMPRVDLLDVMEGMEDQLDMGTAVLGVNMHSEPVMWEMNAENQGHLLIAGKSNCGKTTLLRSIGLSLALLNRQPRMQIVAIDTSSESALSLAPLNQLPHMLSPVLTQMRDAVDMLDFLDEELAFRAHNDVRLPAIAVLIDEVVDVMSQGGGVVLGMLQRLLTYGHTVGIHLVLSTRHPANALVGQLPIDLIPMRVLGCMTSETDATVAAGVVDSEAELMQETGDFVAVVDQKLTDFVGASLDAEGMWLCVDHLRRERDRRLVAHVDAIVNIKEAVQYDDAVTVLEPPVELRNTPLRPEVNSEPEQTRAIVVVEPEKPARPIILPATVEQPDPIEAFLLSEEDEPVELDDAPIRNPFVAMAEAKAKDEAEDEMVMASEAKSEAEKELEYEDDPDFTEFSQLFGREGGDFDDDEIDEFPFE